MDATTVPAVESADATWRLNPSKASVVQAVGRRMVPYLVEATVIPTALFYTFFVAFGLRWAIVAALGWTYAAVGRRVITRRPVPGLLMLATLGITVRTVIYLLSGNEFVYFFQPIMRTVATATVFALSVRLRPAADRPLRRRFLRAQPGATAASRGRRAVPPAHVPVGGGQRARRRGDADLAVDRTGRRLRRYGDGCGVDHHVQRGGAHGVGVGPHGAPRRAAHRGRPPRPTARLRHADRSRLSPSGADDGRPPTQRRIMVRPPVAGPSPPAPRRGPCTAP